jgi:hypothetical protein
MGAAGADRCEPPPRGNGLVGAATLGKGRADPLVISRRGPSPPASPLGRRGPVDGADEGPTLGVIGRVPADDM